MKKAWLCLGSNLDNPSRQVEKAAGYLEEKCFIKILRRSRVALSKPFGYTDQPDFANQLLEIETRLSASELLAFTQEAEGVLGRQPTFKWGPRLIDIDIVFWGDDIINTNNLRIPHPGSLDREYLLILLNEMIPEYVHPQTGLTICQMYHIHMQKGGS